jgi:hypothetical protein
MMIGPSTRIRWWKVALALLALFCLWFYVFWWDMLNCYGQLPCE